jgi:hypothetical protein
MNKEIELKPCREAFEAKVGELEKLLRYATLDELAKESERLGFYNEEQNENN